MSSLQVTRGLSRLEAPTKVHGVLVEDICKLLAYAINLDSCSRVGEREVAWLLFIDESGHDRAAIHLPPTSIRDPTAIPPGDGYRQGRRFLLSGLVA